MAIHLTPALTATLQQIAAETNSSADEITQHAMEEFAAEYQEIRDAVAESDAQFRRGEFLPRRGLRSTRETISQDMIVNWSPRAANDLTRIIARIEEDNATAADRVANRIYVGLMSLSSMSERTSAGRIQGTREMFFPPFPYFAVYRIVGQEGRIVHIRHTSRRCR